MFIEGAISNKIIEATIASFKSGTGAEQVFIGRVRPDRTENAEVSCIEFTAQTAMAEQSVEEIIRESIQQHNILNAEVWHSLGKVYSGEVCFLVVVASVHRKESFEAIQYIVNEIKKRCPIFGEEVLASGDKKWKENTM